MDRRRQLTSLALFLIFSLASTYAQGLFDANRKARQAFDAAYAAQKSGQLDKAIAGYQKALELDHDKVNVHGGACALGHPVGASGARIIVTLLNALQKYDLKRGVASLCIGGGEATAMAIERV